MICIKDTQPMRVLNWEHVSPLTGDAHASRPHVPIHRVCSCDRALRDRGDSRRRIVRTLGWGLQYPTCRGSLDRKAIPAFPKRQSRPIDDRLLRIRLAVTCSSQFAFPSTGCLPLSTEFKSTEFKSWQTRVEDAYRLPEAAPRGRCSNPVEATEIPAGVVGACVRAINRLAGSSALRREMERGKPRAAPRP
jgi:hypothetical protein